jgi:aspartyl-tRNA(Asn)/glutamyl-tRNA(Gln) amidotransferase subunit A
MTALHDLSADALSGAYSRSELSPVEVVRAALGRIEACEPRLNAMYRLSAEAALEQARESERRWREGRSRSSLDGVPVTIKENIATRGDPAPIGTRANEDDPPQAADAPPAARLREAGCVMLGKTTMPDYGMLSAGVSSLHGITRNPWRLDRNPSGSSSGAAAAAAAGYAPLHLGTDIGGSIRLPATHCGLFGLKPSFGRVPIHPPFLGRVAGPMTRTARDAALLLDVIARPDAQDYLSLPPSDESFSHAANEAPAAKPRIGFIADMGVGLPVAAPVRAAAEAAAKAFDAAGCIVEPLASFLTAEMLDGACRFFEARSYNDLCRLPAARRNKVLPFIVEWCSHRAERFTGNDVIQAYAQLMAIAEAAVRALERYDFLLTPTSPILAYEAERPSPTDDPRNALPHIAFTLPYNMSGQPAASVNWRTSDDGLPIGVQIIGKRFDDAGVLRLSRLAENLRPAQRPWPQPVP